MNDLVHVTKDGQTLSVHHTCVKAHQRDGWVIDPNHAKAVDTAPSIDLGTDSGDQFSDDQLRAIIEEVTGKAPHHKTGRDKLITTFNELNKDA